MIVDVALERCQQALDVPNWIVVMTAQVRGEFATHELVEKENEDGSRSFGLAALVVLAPAVASHQTLERAQLAAHLGWNAGARPYGKIEGWEKIKVQRNADVEGLAVFGDIEADVAKLQTDLRSVFLFGGLIAEPVKMTPEHAAADASQLSRIDHRSRGSV